MIDSVDTPIWVVRMNERLPAGIENDYIALGWSVAGDITKIDDWDTMKKSLRDAYPELYHKRERALGGAVGCLWRFIHAINVGDWILVPDYRSFHVAEITGDVYFDADGAQTDSSLRRPVKWITKEPVPRDHAVRGVRSTMKARQTCTEAYATREQIEMAINKTSPIVFYDEVTGMVKEPIKRVLLESINERGLEEVVCQLAKAGGAEAYILATNQKEPGDVDVMAHYPVDLGCDQIIVNYAFQVKQFEGAAGPEGIQQLIDRMEHDKGTNENPEIDKGVLVTTATSLTAEAEKLLEKAGDDILVILVDDLVSWILESGLSALRPEESFVGKYVPMEEQAA